MKHSEEKGIALPLVLIMLVVTMVTAVALLTRTSYELKYSSMNRKLKTASSLANNVATDLLRQFAQNYQDDHYSTGTLNRAAAFYNQGYSSCTVVGNRDQHFLSFEAVGIYGTDINNPQHKKTINGVIKFVSDLTTFGTMTNGSFTTSASNVAYQGKIWINGSWTISGDNVSVLGGPVFVNGNISTSGSGDITINGDLYRTGTRTGSVVVTGADNNFVPQMTWPTIDRTYFDTYYNVRVTANTNVRFRYTAGASTGTVFVGTTPYVIPTTGFIIYGQNCTITSSGTVRGRVTIACLRVSGASGGDIVIDNNLTYATAGSTMSANTLDSFGAVASNSIAWNRTSADLYITGVYFVDSAGTSGMSTTCTGCGTQDFYLRGTRNKGITTSGWDDSVISYDTNLDTYPPPGLPEKPYLVTWRIK